MDTYDAIIIGGGPAGSSCARTLVRGGARVCVLDRARFPRVKLCAGWISAPIWDVLELAPSEYPRGLWEWNTCHVHYGGKSFAVRARGWFIRRYELDDFLLRTSGADVVTGTSVKKIERDDSGAYIVAGRRARHLVGAGGTHCPVARGLFGPKPKRPVGVQEIELQAGLDAVATTRLGEDGEPELLLHDDLRGYAWNVPKSDWLNVGCGTMKASEVRDAWTRARAFFDGAGHLPPSAARDLDRVKGHSYYLFHPAHLDDCENDGALLVGDALGLAQPLTAEGILPATLSGRLAAEAILAGDTARYPRALAAHPIIADYDLIYRARELGSRLRPGSRRRHTNGEAPAASRTRDGEVGRVAAGAVARGFAWMFSGKPLPARRAVAGAVKTLEKVTGR